MTWTNPLDRLPQVPQDWANHIIYGGVLGIAAHLAGLTLVDAAVLTFVVSAIKKGVDFVKEGESAAMCIGKTIVSCLWPLSIAILR